MFVPQSAFGANDRVRLGFIGLGNMGGGMAANLAKARELLALTNLTLAEISERQNVMCLFDEKTRKITTSDGKELQPLTYGSVEGLS